MLRAKYWTGHLQECGYCSMTHGPLWTPARMARVGGFFSQIGGAIDTTVMANSDSLDQSFSTLVTSQNFRDEEELQGGHQPEGDSAGRVTSRESCVPQQPAEAVITGLRRQMGEINSLSARARLEERRAKERHLARLLARNNPVLLKEQTWVMPHLYKGPHRSVGDGSPLWSSTLSLSAQVVTLDPYTTFV